MPLFRCDGCGCVENTAGSGYHKRRRRDGRALCSECDPDIGRWHGKFPKTDADRDGWQPVQPGSPFIHKPD